MKNLIQYFIFVFLVIGLYGFAFANFNTTGDEPAGKKAFVDAKCNTCHSVTSQGITTTSKKQNPDLSTVGKELNAEFLKKYLMKTEQLKTKKHPTLFKGDATNLDEIAKWLASLKK